MLRLVYTVNMVKTKDYTYVKMQSKMWAFAEIAFGLACSCLPILPRLFQHVSSVTPYTRGTSDDTLQDPSTKPSVPTAAQQAAQWRSKGREKGGNWIHLDDRNVTGLPERTALELQQWTEDEEALENAVEGKKIMKADNDLEMERGTTQIR